MADPASQLSVARYDGNRVGIRRPAHALYNPVIGGGCKLERYLGVIAALRTLRRTRAVEHEPDLSVRIREAPGESDQALSHRVGPEGFLAGRFGFAISVICGARAKRRAVQDVVAVDEPLSCAWKGIESPGRLIPGIRPAG